MKQAASRKLDLPLISALEARFWKDTALRKELFLCTQCTHGTMAGPIFFTEKCCFFFFFFSVSPICIKPTAVEHPSIAMLDNSGEVSYPNWGKLQCWRANAFPPPIRISIDSHKDSRWSSQYCHLVPIVLRFLLYILCWSNIEVDCTPPFFILFLFGPYFELFTLELANLFPGLVVGGY